MHVFHLAILEEYQHRDVAHAELHGEFAFSVGIAFADNGFAFVFSSHLLDVGPKALQGPHQGAQKSITTNLSPLAIVSKFSDVIANAIFL